MFGSNTIGREMENKLIKISHGSGGIKTNELIKNLILKYLNNPILNELNDGSILPIQGNKIVVSTDSFVVSPHFFNGGDIGKLSITGTINDIAVSGGIPKFITLSFILEEGFSIDLFEKILKSIKKTSEENKVLIVTGDLKVVEKSKGDGIFINTTGIGELHSNYSPEIPEPGDLILISGSIGDHGACIISQRNQFGFESNLISDCNSVLEPIIDLLDSNVKIKFMRDPTRGGLGAVLNEIVDKFGISIEIYENNLPIKDEVIGISEILGIDPIYLPNEGRFIAIIPEWESERAISILKKHELTKETRIIGTVIKSKINYNFVILKTRYGSERIIESPIGELLPRIC